MDHPLPWLKYVDAKDLEDKENSVKLAGIEVEDPAGEKLGTVEAFILDVATGSGANSRDFSLDWVAVRVSYQ